MNTIRLFALTLLFTLPLSVQAVGVAVYPAEIQLETVTDEETTTRIKVSNPSSDVAVFEVYPDEFDQLIKVTPRSFTLESNEERQVTITITPREEGRFQTTISVVARPMASSAFQAGSGVKVPFTITSKEDTAGFASAVNTLTKNPWFISGAVFVLAIILFQRVKLRKSNHTT